MKRYIICLFITSLVSTAFAQSTSNQFGAPVDENNAISVKELVAKMDGKTEMDAKVEGKVISVCQAKGCWMTLDKGDGSKMRVTFKDYGFFVPKDLSGKTVVVQGKAQVITTSVAELQHYAEDAGKSKEEIAKITEPEHELAFEADGVLVKN